MNAVQYRCPECGRHVVEVRGNICERCMSEERYLASLELPTADERDFADALASHGAACLGTAPLADSRDAVFVETRGVLWLERRSPAMVAEQAGRMIAAGWSR